MKRFKSINRAMKRGHLQVKFRQVFSGQNDQTTGLPLMREVPYLVRNLGRFNDKGKTVFYSNI